MKNKLIWKLAAIALIAVVGLRCAQKQQKLVTIEDWRSRMHRLTGILGQVLPLAVNARAFHDPKNLELIKEQTAEMARLAIELEKDKISPMGDPSLQFAAKKFAQEMTETSRQLEYGNMKYARMMLANSPSYCISCHTRSNQGQENLGLDAKVDLSGFSPMERTQFWMAIRQYDKVFSHLDEATADSKMMAADPRGWELGIEKALALTVRVKQDPQQALTLTERILKEPQVPVYVKQYAQVWRESLKAWKKKENINTMGRPLLLRRAEQFINQGHQASAHLPDAGLIEYLRASLYLQKILNESPRDQIYGTALYFAGIVAEELKDSNLWTAPDSYFEACIRYQPHTSLAKKCYVKYEALMMGGLYIDDPGANIPDYLRGQMSELKALAEDQNKEKLLKENKDYWELLDFYKDKNN